MTKLKQEWGSGQSALICGTDGRLKEGIGTNGYIINRKSDKAELITGYATEDQPGKNTSSTRQELRAQMAIYCWLEHIRKIYGETKQYSESCYSD